MNGKVKRGFKANPSLADIPLQSEFDFYFIFIWHYHPRLLFPLDIRNLAETNEIFENR